MFPASREIDALLPQPEKPPVPKSPPVPGFTLSLGTQPSSRTCEGWTTAIFWNPAFGSPDIEPVEGEAAAEEELYDHEPLWEEGGDLAGALEALLTASGEVMDIARLRYLTCFPEGALRMGLEKLQERLQPPSGVRGRARRGRAPHP